MIAFLFHLKKSSQSTSAFYECFTVPHSNVQRLQVMRPTYTVQQIRPPHGSSGSADDGKIQHLIVSQQQPATGIAQQQQQPAHTVPGAEFEMKGTLRLEWTIFRQDLQDEQDAKTLLNCRSSKPCSASS